MKKLIPVRSIRKKCLSCMIESADQVNRCHLEKCPLWAYRFGKKPISNNGKRLLTSLKSIKSFCLECSSFNKAEVRSCDIQDCVLYPFRLGKNPNLKGRKGNPDALRKYRFSKVQRPKRLLIADRL